MVDIAHAPPEERAEITAFMAETMPRVTWTLPGWQRLLSARWGQPGDSYAITARDNGKLVGVLGLIPSRRRFAGATHVIRNLTSWYILKPWRGQGIGTRIMSFAAADENVTVTNLTSARGALPVVHRTGFAVLDETRFLWHARAGANALPLIADPLGAGSPVSDTDQQVLRDHAGLNVVAHVIETPDGPCTVVHAPMRRHDAYVSCEVLYVGDHARFSRHARAIADTILPARDAVLSVDSRFVPGEEAAPNIREAIPVPRFYTPDRMPREAVDHLYSEIVLVDMKIY